MPIFSASAPFPSQDCALCGVESGDCVVCPACEGSLHSPEPDLEGRIAAFAYLFPLDRLVQRFKFSEDLAVGRWLAAKLAERVAACDRPDFLVPPPLWSARLRARGFNPALEIARGVGRRLGGIPILCRGASRLRDTGSQAGLGREARSRNLQGAFAIERDLHGRRAAIVDDVLTTGATAQSLARALEAAGAEVSGVWVVARTPKPGQPG